jgi:hypothetical protein
MTPVHVRMPDAAEDSEILAMLPEAFEVRREGILAPGVLRKELIGQQSKVVTDPQETPWFAAGRLAGRACDAGKRRSHYVQKRQGKQHARAAEKGAS